VENKFYFNKVLLYKNIEEMCFCRVDFAVLLLAAAAGCWPRQRAAAAATAWPGSAAVAVGAA